MTDVYHSNHRVRGLLEQFGIEEDRPIIELPDLKQEIYRYGKRRCDVEASTDNLKYYLGFAFEVNDGLEIDSLALCGLLSLPWEVITISHQIEGDKPLRLIDAFKVALRDPDVLTLSRREGIRLQWKRLEAIYQREVDEFRASDAFQRTRWRQRSITRPQHYLIGQIHRILSVPIPTLTTRGEAYDFISEHGGNPRFPIGQSIPHSQPRA